MRVGSEQRSGIRIGERRGASDSVDREWIGIFGVAEAEVEVEVLVEEAEPGRDGDGDRAMRSDKRGRCPMGGGSGG